MLVFVYECHFLYDLLNVFVSSFYNTIHLWPVRGRIVMLDLELFAQGGDLSVVQVRTIVCNDSLRDTVMTDEILLEEPGDNVLGDESEGGCLNPLCKIVNGH